MATTTVATEAAAAAAISEAGASDAGGAAAVAVAFGSACANAGGVDDDADMPPSFKKTKKKQKKIRETWVGLFADRTSDIGVVVGEYDGRGAHGGQLRLPIVRLVDGTEVNAEVMWTKAYLYSHYEVAQLAWANDAEARTKGSCQGGTIQVGGVAVVDKKANFQKHSASMTWGRFPTARGLEDAHAPTPMAELTPPLPLVADQLDPAAVVGGEQRS